MKQLWFADLKRLHVLEYYEEAFSKATGVSLAIVPPEETRQCPVLGSCVNAFCSLLGCTAAGSDDCVQTHLRAQRVAAQKLVPQQIHCFAGLTVAAVPVVIEGKHMATLISGRVFRHEPTEDDLARVLRRNAGALNGNWQEQARKAYFETPVVSEERFEAIIYLLNVFAQQLADYAARCAAAPTGNEPRVVGSAKRFIQSHIEERSVLTQVLQHVHVSRCYFCKLFKKSTGMTLTEYAARVRVEKAKALLVDSSLRITDVVYSAGFGSIPRFNSVFRRYTGIAPRQYRASLRSRSFGAPQE